jgi:Leucine-rich repeat (LRR) protein
LKSLPETFSKLSNLEVLHLSINDIDNLEINILKSLAKLQSLAFYKNKLTTFAVPPLQLPSLK